MLEKLLIDNYALIDKTGIDFNPGFTVITGETGAGKSIMLDALSLLMGARADSKAQGNKEQKTIVEAIFSNPDDDLRQIFSENGLEWDEREIILRREISASGKNRSFINDTPVNLAVLSAISEKLLDIHSQNKNNILNRPQEQLAILDAYGNTKELLEKYKTSFRSYVSLRHKIQEIKANLGRLKENREFILFRLEQLDKLKPVKGELENLEREFEILSDADRIKSDIAETIKLLDGDRSSALRQLKSAGQIMDGIDMSLLDARGEDNLNERFENLKIELRDIADTLEEYAEKINSDPERYEKVKNRLENLDEAMRRFKVKDENELVDLHLNLRKELETLSGEESDLPSMEKRLKELARDLKKEADSLSEQREKSAVKLSKTIEEYIRPLGLPNVRFEVKTEKGKMSPDGQDNVTFLCSFNKNHPLQPVSQIASGGERARLMLGIKSIMAGRMELPTIIFDEIDTGVSGEIAHKMGKMMKKMSDSLQVLAVTHLPQVAACGDTHLKVYKEDNQEKTVSHIKTLSENERMEEIAGMLSASSINEVALENARVLLQNKED